MKNLRKRFDRFCFRHRDKGIPNLMLYLCIGSAIVYLFSMYDQSGVLYNALCFDRELILQGQVWRLFSYALTFSGGNVVFTFIGLFCYYSLGRAVEHVWGTLRFNLFYLCGIVLMDAYCLVFKGYATIDYLNLSLFLAYATLFPSAQFLLFFIIPIKAWVLAVVDLAFTLYDVIVLSIPYFYFPYNLFPLIAIANYFLFFGKDFVNVFPDSWRINARRLVRRGKQKVSRTQKPKVVPFPTAGAYQSSAAKAREAYTHKCTVCGRTDVSDPQLEFRYCSRCNGYHCYCQDHISNHSHIQ